MYWEITVKLVLFRLVLTTQERKPATMDSGFSTTTLNYFNDSAVVRVCKNNGYIENTALAYSTISRFLASLVSCFGATGCIRNLPGNLGSERNHRSLDQSLSGSWSSSRFVAIHGRLATRDSFGG